MEPDTPEAPDALSAKSDGELIALDEAATEAIEAAGGLMSLAQIGAALVPPITQQRVSQLFESDPNAPKPVGYTGHGGHKVYSAAGVTVWARHARPPRTLGLG